MYLPKVVQLPFVLKILHSGPRQPPQIFRMFPALPKSSVAEGNQGTDSNKAGIAMRIVGLFLHKSAHASVCAVNKVDNVLAHAMQARWETLVLDSVQISARMALFPGYGIPW